MAKPAGSNVGDLRAAHASPSSPRRPAGPADRSTAMPSSTSRARARASACTVVDLAVDADTGIVTVGRYTAAQDVGTAIHPSLRRGPAPGRRRAGHRLGAERGVHLQRQGQAREPGLPRLPHAGRLRPADDRDHPGRGAQPDASLRRARRRRSADRAAHRRGRQRHRPRHRRPHDRPADVAAAPHRRRSTRRGPGGWRRSSDDRNRGGGGAAAVTRRKLQHGSQAFPCLHFLSQQAQLLGQGSGLPQRG